MEITKLQLAEILDRSPSFITHLVDKGKVTPIKPEERNSPFTVAEVKRYITEEREKVSTVADARMSRLNATLKRLKQKIAKDKQIDGEINKLSGRIDSLKKDKRKIATQ